jgi:hypothetical protein
MCGVTETDCSCTASISSQNSEHCQFEFNHRLTLRPSRRPNHASWERNEAAKIALGPKFAVWIWQGIVEMVPLNCPLPLFIEPLGAVDKATPPWWRLILDTRNASHLKRVPGRLGRLVLFGLPARGSP